MSASYINTELYDNEIIRRYQQMVPILKDKLEKTLRLYSNMVRQHAECHEGDVFRLDTSEYTRHLADVVRHLDEMQLLLSAISAWGSLPIECMGNPAGRGAGPPGMDGSVIDFNMLEAEGRSQLERMMSVQNILQKCRVAPPQSPPHMTLHPQGAMDGDENQLQSMISSEEDRDAQSLLGKPEHMEGIDQEDLHIMSLDTTLKELAEDGAIGFEDSVMEDSGGVGELLDDDFSMSPPAVISSLPPPTNPASVPVASMQTPPPPPPPRPSTASERITQISQPIRPASNERSPWLRPKDEPRSSRPSSNDSSGGIPKQEDAGGGETPLENLLRSRPAASPGDAFSGAGSRPPSVSMPSFTPPSQTPTHPAFQPQGHKSASPQQYLQLTPQHQQLEESPADQLQPHEHNQQQIQQQQPMLSQPQQFQRVSHFEQQQQQQQAQHLQLPLEPFNMEPSSVPPPTMSSVKMEEVDEEDAFGGTS